MARRIKEEPTVHQNRIADEAGRLFEEKGAVNTTMDDVARAAGYSKATLYVYFRNKDEIVAFLALRSMTLLKDTILSAIRQERPFKERFIEMCFVISDYACQYPDYFQVLLHTIPLYAEQSDESFCRQVFQTGEEINHILLDCLAKGCREGVISDRNYGITDVLQIWGMISGVIQIALQKQNYIRLISSANIRDFLREGFEKIYGVLAR